MTPVTELVSVAAIAVVVLLTVVVGARGIRIARTPADFMVAAREVSPPVNAAAISGEYLSAASFLGIAGLIFSQGLGSLWYSVGYAAGYLVLLLLIAAPLRRFGAYTIPDFAGGRLHSARLRLCSTVLVMIIGWFYLLPQMDGAGLTLQVVLGCPYWVGVVVLGVVVSGNIAMGGMKGVTFVQAFQYWLKLCAIGIPTIILIILVGHGSMLNLAPDHSPAFARTTTVSIPENLQFTVTRSTPVTVTGTLDGRPEAQDHATLRPGTYSVGAGSSLVFPAGARVPARVGLVPAHAPAWDSPFVSVGADGAHPLAATYGLIVATVLRRDRSAAHPGAVLHQSRRRRGAAHDAHRALPAQHLLPVPGRARGDGQAPRPAAVPDRQHRRDRAGAAGNSAARRARRGPRCAGRGGRLRCIPFHLVRPAGQRRGRALA